VIRRGEEDSVRRGSPVDTRNGGRVTPHGTVLLPARNRDRTHSGSVTGSHLLLPQHASSMSQRSVSGIDRAYSTTPLGGGKGGLPSASHLPRPDSPPVVGSCPGDGRCNGTGGKSGCEGCPTYNNSSSKTVESAPVHAPSRSRMETSTQSRYPGQGANGAAGHHHYASNSGHAHHSGMDVEPGYNPLIAASHAQRGYGAGQPVRSPVSRNGGYSDEEEGEPAVHHCSSTCGC
jgi:hypothetical protein